MNTSTPAPNEPKSRKELFEEEIRLLSEVLPDPQRGKEFIKTELLEPCEKFIDTVKRRKVKPQKSRAQQLHGLKTGKLDLYSPESILASVNLANVVNEKNFKKLPVYLQYELTKLLPKCDQITLPNGAIVPSETAFNNSNMIHRIQQFSLRMQEGNLSWEWRNRAAKELERARKLVDPFKIKHFEPFVVEERAQTEDEKIEQISEQLMTVVKQHELCKVILEEKFPLLEEKAFLKDENVVTSGLKQTVKSFNFETQWTDELTSLKRKMDRDDLEAIAAKNKIKVIPIKVANRGNRNSANGNKGKSHNINTNISNSNLNANHPGIIVTNTLNNNKSVTPVTNSNTNKKTNSAAKVNMKILHSISNHKFNNNARGPEIIKVSFTPISDLADQDSQNANHNVQNQNQNSISSHQQRIHVQLKLRVCDFISQGNAILRAHFMDTHLPVPMVPMQKNNWDMYIQSLQNAFCIFQLYFRKAEVYTNIMQLRIMGNLLMPTVVVILDTCKSALEPVHHRQENDRQILRIMFGPEFTIRKQIPPEVETLMNKLDDEVQLAESVNNYDYVDKIIVSLKTKFDLLSELFEKSVLPVFKTCGEVEPKENSRLLAELRSFAQAVRHTFGTNLSKPKSTPSINVKTIVPGSQESPQIHHWEQITVAE